MSQKTTSSEQSALSDEKAALSQQKATALISLEDARQLVRHLELGKVEAANLLLARVSESATQDLVVKVGSLTRQVHDSLSEFRLDSRLSDLANQEIPDARDRLGYVIEMTDKAANRTMDAVEASLPLADKLGEHIQQVLPSWNDLMNRELQLGQFKLLCHQLDDFLKSTEIDVDKLRSLLTEILMAQDFQDLTGQMIRRVIQLVQEVEDQLVEMLAMFGSHEEKVAYAPCELKAPDRLKAEGPVHNSSQRDDVVNSQDDVDDLLSSLGF